MPLRPPALHAANLDAIALGHLQEFDPSDMGALYGTQFLTPTGLKMWTGAELVKNTEFWDMVYLYDAPPHPRIVQLIADEFNMTRQDYEEFLRQGADARRAQYRQSHNDEPWNVPKKKTETEDEWDVYLKKFLAEHKLPEAAVERARETTREAQKIRDAHREKNRAAKRGVNAILS